MKRFKVKWTFLHTIAAVLLALFIVMLAIAEKAQWDWEQFVIVHQCRIVSEVIIVQHYKCADGSEYWK